MSQTDAMARAARAKKVTWVGFWVNVVLSVAKIIAGIVGRSGAMIADGVHSISDFVTDIIVIVFIGVSAKGENTRFRYGHGKFETFATMLISFALFAVAVGLFWTSFNQIVDALNGKVLPRPEMVALVMAFVSVVAKEWLFHYTRVAGEQMNSMALVANAWHHRSDAFSSIAVLVGIGCAMFLGERWRVLDPIAAATVSYPRASRGCFARRCDGRDGRGYRQSRRCLRLPSSAHTQERQRLHYGFSYKG